MSGNVNCIKAGTQRKLFTLQSKAKHAHKKQQPWVKTVNRQGLDQKNWKVKNSTVNKITLIYYNSDMVYFLAQKKLAAV